MLVIYLLHLRSGCPIPILGDSQNMQPDNPRREGVLQVGILGFFLLSVLLLSDELSPNPTPHRDRRR